MEPATAAAADIKPVVIAPTYNNAGTVAGVLSGAASMGLPVIVVNDGSTDSTALVLRCWLKDHPQYKATVLTHKRNRGKAAALRTGFAAAMKAGYTHALTIDTDAQHDPKFIAPMLERARQTPEAYILGVRDARAPEYPRKSRLGRRFSNILIRLECGLKVADSQCGMRVYPLELVRTVSCLAGRFGYEAEMITRAGWADCPIVEMPINTCYLPPGERVSHFRPWGDTIRAIGMHARLLLVTVAPVPHRRYRPAGRKLRPRFSLKALLSWMNPFRAWRELREGAIDRSEFAAAMSTGVFVANLPVYPLQTVLCLYLARRLHLNPLAVLAGSQISTPPITFVLIAAAIYLGHLILHGSLPSVPDLHTAHTAWRTLGKPFLIDWAVGGPLVGIILGAITFALANHFYHGVPDPLEEPEEGGAGEESCEIDQGNAGVRSKGAGTVGS